MVLAEFSPAGTSRVIQPGYGIGRSVFLCGAFDRAARFVPGPEPVFQMRRLEPHILQGCCGNRGTTARGAVKYVFLTLLREDILVIGAIGIDLECDHAARGVKAAGDEPGALTLAHVTNIDNHPNRIVDHRNQIAGVPQARVRGI